MSETSRITSIEEYRARKNEEALIEANRQNDEYLTARSTHVGNTSSNDGQDEENARNAALDAAPDTQERLVDYAADVAQITKYTRFFHNKLLEQTNSERKAV